MLGLGAMLLTSCDQDIVNEIYLPGGGGSVVVTDSTSTKQLQVFTNLEMLQPAVSTRAVDNQWELNDMIGISSTGMINNMKFTRSGGTNQFVSANKVFFTDTDTHTFNAYYPYTANPTNDLIEFQVPEAAVQSEQKVNDFLFASGAASYANPSLTLNFTHQMCVSSSRSIPHQNTVSPPMILQEAYSRSSVILTAVLSTSRPER